MASRLELHEELCDILGSRNVYFQPPPSVKLIYPAIVYSRSGIDKIPADDIAYLLPRRYMVTLIEHDPDTETIDKLLKLPYCMYDRHYAADNLNHEVFRSTIKEDLP